MAITNTPNEVVHQAYKSDKRSWFALKHTHLSSYQPGYEHPDLVLPITGNTTVKLNMSRYLQSAPTVTPLFDSMRVNFRVFFAPQRLYTRGLYGNNFEEVDNIEEIELPILPPQDSGATLNVSAIMPGSLLNRLGYPSCLLFGSTIQPLVPNHYADPDDMAYTIQDAEDGNVPFNVRGKWNLTPIVAYFDIWNHYIRNPYVEYVPVTDQQVYILGQSPFTDVSVSYQPAQVLVNSVLGVRGVVSSQFSFVERPSYYILRQNGDDGIFDNDWSFGGIVPLVDRVFYNDDTSTTLYDFVNLLKGRVTSTGMLPTNFGEHYQTMFYDEEEINNLNSIVIETDDDGNPTVEGLRLGKSIWNKTLRTILRGRKYTDWVDVQFGSKLKMSDHPIFVGSDSMIVSFQDILNQSSQGDVPLGKAAGAGARGGKNADSDRTIVFTAQEPGYLMVLVDFVPEVSYTNVVPRWLEYETMSSFPMPAYSGRTFQDLKVSDLCFVADGSKPDVNDMVIGKQPLYFDFMSSYNRSSALFSDAGDSVSGASSFRSYTFQRLFDLYDLSEGGAPLVDYMRSTYILPTTFDYNFADVGQNGRQNFWMKTEYNIRLFQPLEKQVVSGRI